MKTYKIFTLKMARALIDQGYKVVETLPNKEKPWLNVYCFEDSRELRSAVKQLSTN